MVSKPQLPPFVREFAESLASRLLEPRRYIQVVTGARQVGKTTLVRQVLSGLDHPHRFASADEPTLRDAAWLRAQWDSARKTARESDVAAVLALDEIQKIPGWSETVKRLWDEDTASGMHLHVVLLGSAPLLVQAGLVESLAGARYHNLTMWHPLRTEGEFTAVCVLLNMLSKITQCDEKNASPLLRTSPRENLSSRGSRNRDASSRS